MVSKEDWAAAMSSEVFNEYVKISTNSEKNKPVPVTVDEHQVLAELRKFQHQIRNNPRAKQVFKALQAKFASDPVYRAKVNPAFVEGVMLLNLNDQVLEE